MKVAVVTGGSRGLGKATVEALSAKGYKVFSLVRKADCDLVSSNIFNVEVDLADELSIERAVHKVLSETDEVDLLINNAGVFLDYEESFFDLGLDTLLDTLKVNLFAPIKLIQGLKDLFINGAQIINISSTYGKLDQMRGLNPAYRISKSALNAVTRIVSDELSSKNIKVNSVCPGWVRTDMGGGEAAKSIEEGIDSIIWLAVEQHGYNGCFIRDRQELVW